MIYSTLYSETLFNIGIPAPTSITGRFVYRYFEPGENTDEVVGWLDRLYENNDRSFNIYGSPRYVEIEFPETVDEFAEPLTTALTADQKSILIDPLRQLGFAAVVGVNMYGEAHLQKNGYVIITIMVKNFQEAH